jgi:phage-related tail fiber protein
VGHGLGVAPGMIIVKERTSTSGWFVYTSTTGAGNYLSLSGTGASAGSTTIWNNTAPTSSVFSVGANNGSNENTQDYVAYCFAEVEGFSKFGSYTGTGSSTAGPFVYLGFRPAFVMIKRTDSTGSSWYMQDTTRNTFNALDNLLFANVSNAEGTWSGSALEGMDALSNGFKWRNGYLDSNANGGTYIYMAFAENPFKNSLAR